jgi:hypothetical protein
MKLRFYQFMQPFSFTSITRLVIMLGFALDILTSIYFITYWRVQNVSEKMWQQALMLRGENWYELEREFQLELSGILDQNVGIMLMTIVLANLVFYFYFCYRKKWAWHYLVAYFATAVLMALSLLTKGFPVGGPLEVINIASIPMYLILAAILWARKSDFTQKGFRLKSN